MKSYHQLKRKLLSDPKVRQAYDDLAGEFEIIDSVIAKRLERKMSQKDLADKIGTKQSAISRLESGQSNPSYLFLKKVATALGAQLHISID
jgi:ribosome-binding protein aMBF1 (putative translation factor)